VEFIICFYCRHYIYLKTEAAETRSTKIVWMISIFWWLMADLVKSHTEGKKSTFYFSYSAAVMGSQVTTELKVTVAYNHDHSWKTKNSLYRQVEISNLLSNIHRANCLLATFCILVGLLIRVKTIENAKLLLCYIWITYRSSRFFSV